MSFADTRDQQEKLFPLVRSFFDELNASKDKEQVLLYDYYMNIQSLKELRKPMSFYTQRLLKGLMNYLGFNRGALAIRNDSGFFVIKHTSYKDKNPRIICKMFLMLMICIHFKIHLYLQTKRIII